MGDLGDASPGHGRVESDPQVHVDAVQIRSVDLLASRKPMERLVGSPLEGMMVMMMMEQRNSSWTPSGADWLTEAERGAVDTLYRAFNSADPDLLDGVLADDWQDTPMAPGQQPGRDGMKPMVRAFLAAFSDLRLTPEEVVGFGGRAAVRLTLSGRHTGDWAGVPATGRAFSIAMHELHHLRDGRITHTWHLEDWAGWREQVGVAGQE